MRFVSSKLLVLIAVAFATVPCVVAGCATSDAPADDATDDTGATTVKKDAGKTTKKKDASVAASTDDTGDAIEDPGSTKPTDSGIKDGSAPKDSATAPKDSGVFPAEGTACTTAGEQLQKPCGMCGYSKTFCGMTGGTLVWQPYGFCDQPVDAECVAGTIDTGSCGNCGTATRVCQTDCHYQLGACSEPAGACPPGLRTFNVGLSCAVGPSSGRETVCDTTCKWGLPGDCTTRATTLTLPTTVGATVNNEFTLTPLTQQIDALYFADCPADVYAGSPVSYAFVKITNPNAKAAKVSLWTKQSLTGPALATVVFVYNRATAPVTESDRIACASAAAGYDCDVSPCDPSGDWGGLVGANAVTVPAGGSIQVYVEPENDTDTGTFQLYARVDAL